MPGKACLFVCVLIGLVAGVAVRTMGETAASQPDKTPVAQAASSQPATSPSAATQAAGRVLLRQDFEREKGDWTGEIITDNVPPGSTRALAAVANETHWARRATVGSHGVIRATADTVLTFRYRMSKDIPVTIYIMDRTQKDNLRYDIKKPVVGKWTEVSVSVNTGFRRNDGSAGKLQPGDLLTGISFLSGKTGVDEFDLAVDDVMLTGQVD